MSKITPLLFVLILIATFWACENKNSKETSQSADSNPVAIASALPETPSGGIKKYPLKSGIITFDNNMMGIKEKSVLFFDDYGMKEAEDKYDGETMKETNLCDGQKHYTINHAEKTAYDAGSCYRGIAYKFDWNEISQADKEYKVKKGPDMTIAGKICESYSMVTDDYPTTFAGWNNILLYQETKSKYGTIILKAVKVEENVSIPAEKLQIPKGYTIKKPGA